MDRPSLAANPVGRVVYAISGFSYAYWRNIIKRNAILIGEKAGKERGGPAKAALYGGALFAAAATAYAANLIITTVREKLLNPERWADLEKDGKLEEGMAMLAFQRTFSFGAADVAINAWTGLKYQRDLSNSFIGAGPGVGLQAGQKVLGLTTQNSRKTNAAEFSAAQGAYTLASPFIAFGLARIPGGAMVDTATGLGIAAVSSPVVRDGVASLIAGPKGAKGGTGFDRMEDGIFGPTPKKERAKKTRSLGY